MCLCSAAERYVVVLTISFSGNESDSRNIGVAARGVKTKNGKARAGPVVPLDMSLL
jgi:hypothetical protein